MQLANVTGRPPSLERSQKSFWPEKGKCYRHLQKGEKEDLGNERLAILISANYGISHSRHMKYKELGIVGQHQFTKGTFYLTIPTAVQEEINGSVAEGKQWMAVTLHTARLSTVSHSSVVLRLGIRATKQVKNLWTIRLGIASCSCLTKLATSDIPQQSEPGQIIVCIITNNLDCQKSSLGHLFVQPGED